METAVSFRNFYNRFLSMGFQIHFFVTVCLIIPTYLLHGTPFKVDQPLRNDPDRYVQVSLLKNKYDDTQIEQLVNEAKKAGLTAYDLIQIKEIDARVTMHRNRQGVLVVGTVCGAIAVCLVVGRLPDIIRVWRQY